MATKKKMPVDKNEAKEDPKEEASETPAQEKAEIGQEKGGTNAFMNKMLRKKAGSRGGR